MKWIASRLSARGSDYEFVNLTLKQGIKRDDGIWAPLTPEDADSNTRQFLNTLSRKVYGNMCKKHGKRLTVVDCAEGGGDSECREHRHMLIEMPLRFGETEFQNLIREVWRKTLWAREHDRIERARDIRRVISYMTKTGIEAIRFETSTF